MWKVPVLFLVLGNASLWLLAEGASTVLPEDDTTPGVEGSSKMSPGVEDYTVNPGASEKPHETPLVPVRTKSTTGRPREDLSTVGSTIHSHTGSQSTATPNVVTSQSQGKGDKEKPKTVTKDGLGTVTLIGIIVGVLLAIGFIGGVIIVLVRKMSGRYSP